MRFLSTVLLSAVAANADPGPAAGGAAAEPVKASLGERFKAMGALLVGNETKLSKMATDLSAANTTVATLTTENGTLKADLAAARLQLAEVETAVTAAEAETTRLNALEKDLGKRTDAGVKEGMASLGFPAAKLPAASEKTAPALPQNREQLEKEMSALKGPGAAQKRQDLLAAYRSAEAKAKA